MKLLGRIEQYKLQYYSRILENYFIELDMEYIITLQLDYSDGASAVSSELQ